MLRRKFLLLTLFLLACGRDRALPLDTGDRDEKAGPGIGPPPPPAPPPPVPLPPPPPAGEPSVWLADADGQHQRRITDGGSPAWSPDGSRLLVVREEKILVVDTTGRELGWLRWGKNPAWSPDGRRIAFTSSEGIEVMNADGGDARLILPHLFRTDTYAPWDMGVGKPVWSPDGTRIAFEHLGDGDLQPAQIFVMNADGSSPRLLNQFESVRYAESDPAWSPDGSRILFWSYGYGLASAPATGGPLRTYYKDFPAVAYGSKPSWHPDGSRIVFTAHRWAGPQIWSLTVDSGPPVLLVMGGFDAAWSPDGRRIAFGSGVP